MTLMYKWLPLAVFLTPPLTEAYAPEIALR